MQKIRNIEFLRMFLIISIVLFHMRTVLNKLDCDIFHQMFTAWHWARNGVEGFFIISGFLFILTLKNTPVFDFIKKKFIRLAPAAMFSVITCYVASLFKIISFKVMPNIVSGLLLCNFPIYWCRGSNVALWYTSSLFLTLIVFFLITKYVKEKYHMLIFFILSASSYMLLTIFHKGSYAGYSSILFGFISVSTLRAFGSFGLGCIFARMYQFFKDKIDDFNPDLIQKIMITSIEVTSLGFIFWWSYFEHEKIDNIVYVLAFSILFISFIFKKGLFSILTDKKIWEFLGKYQYSMFVMHLPVLNIFYRAVLSHHKAYYAAHPFLTITELWIIIILASVIVYYMVEQPFVKCFLKRGKS